MEVLINITLTFTVTLLIGSSFWIVHSFISKWTVGAFHSLQELHAQEFAFHTLACGAGATPDIAAKTKTSFMSEDQTDLTVKNSGFKIQRWILVKENGDSLTWFVSSFTKQEWNPQHHER